MIMNQEGYPVFKGLQKPLEFMGIRGRFLTLAAMEKLLVLLMMEVKVNIYLTGEKLW